MPKFVGWQNIDRYRLLLSRETDDARRRVIKTLLAEEEAIWSQLLDRA